MSLQTLTLDGLDDRPLVTVASVYQSVADGDATVQLGMAGGARETYDRLADVIEQSLTRA